MNANDGFIVPDAIGILKGRQVYIEFANTHFVDERKKEVLENLNVASFEVDLSSTVLDEQEALNLFAATSTYKSWLSNPELDKKYKEHQQQLLEMKKDEEAKNKERIRLRKEKEKQEQIRCSGSWL